MQTSSRAAAAIGAIAFAYPILAGTGPGTTFGFVVAGIAAFVLAVLNERYR